MVFDGRGREIDNDAHRRVRIGMRRTGRPLGLAAVRLRLRAELCRASGRDRGLVARLLCGGNELGGFTRGLLLFVLRRASGSACNTRQRACADVCRMHER